ncbi:MAG: hypothetical protein M1546_24545, partial [Chloroflexi bacterium]|nr:hypothetical protein [Chloroflexota bacterium]
MNKLNVCVDFELTLDAGWWEEVRGGDGSVQRLVHPPATTLFDQLIAYLSKVPDKEPHYFLRLQEEVAAAFAVCVRWGTYFAVLADRTKPPCAEMGIEDASRIDDGEMARINIEASAALAQWIDMKRGDFNRYRALVYAARHHLPLTPSTCDPT